MTAPVTISPTTPSAPATSAGASVGINTLLGGNALFGSFLSTNKAANADAAVNAPEQSPYKIGGGTLMMFAQDGTDISLNNLKSLLDSLGDTSSELNTKILVALTPGTPAQDILDKVQAQLTALGIDPSQVSTVFVQPASQLPPVPTENVLTPAPVAPNTKPVTAENPLVLDSTTADNAANFLLVTTNVSPSEMESLKDAIKALVNADGNTIDTASVEKDQADDKTDLTATETSLVLMVYVTPPPKPIEPAVSADLSLDVSALSAFTQPLDSDVAPADDWTKKLSEKLSSMSLTDDASPFVDTDASPFDDEMNDILSFNTPKATETGFQGSISSTSAHAKEKATALAKDVAGSLSADATSAMSNFSTVPSGVPQHLNADSLLMANGNMLAVQNNMASPLTNPLFTSSTAIGTHPSIHVVAAVIEKASGSEKAKQELSVQLDPPELGRMQVHLSMEKDGAMKVHLLAESQDTLNLFQRDAHALKAALDQAGIQMDSSSLTFDLASGDQSFNQLMGGSQQDAQSGNRSGSTAGTRGIVIDNIDANITNTKMDFVPDKVTGNIHYSFWA